MLNLLLRCRPPRFRLCSASVVASSALLWLVAASSVTAQLGLPPPELSSRERKACEAFREIVALNQQALQSPEVFRSRAWRDAEDRLFAYQVSPSERQAGMFQALKEIWNCHCPIVTGRRKIHQYWQAKMEGKANPQAMATLWQHVKTEFDRTEECYRGACQAPVPAPRVERNPLDKLLFPDAGAQDSSAPRPPLQGDISFTDIPAAGPGTVVIRDSQSGETLTIGIEVDKGGGAPSEPGVDWEGWYKKWISTVTQKVHVPLEKRFAPDEYGYKTIYVYRVYPDGRLVRLGGSWRSEGIKSPNYSTSVMNLMQSLKAPPFPPGSKLPYIDRSFTFSHNMSRHDGRPAGITLGGPPREPAAKMK